MEKIKFIDTVIENKKDIFIKASDTIWENPELYFNEKNSSKIIMDILKKENFDVKDSIDNIPTAFIGSFGSGKPVIAILGEFDALPGLSQVANLAEKKELVINGAGHGCGHHALGIGSLAGAIAVKRYLEKNNLSGTIRYYGCPAEEIGWSKMFLVKDGYFSDVDAAITWHPSSMNRVQGSSTLANLCAYFSFTGKAAHAAAAPHLGRSALDACELMNVGVNYLREHIIPEAKIHYAYLDVGGEAPNVVQSHSCLKYFIRAPKIKQVLEIAERVKKIAKGAALMTETIENINFTAGMCDFIPNGIISNIMTESLFEIGVPNFDEEDISTAQLFFNTFSQDEINSSLKRMSESYDNVENFKNCPLIKEISNFKRSNNCGFGSTDVGDVSYCVPTAQLQLSSFANGTPAHSWQATAQGKTNAMHKSLLTAGKILALTAIKLLENPIILKEAKNEYIKETGGKYICPVSQDTKPIF